MSREHRQSILLGEVAVGAPDDHRQVHGTQAWRTLGVEGYGGTGVQRANARDIGQVRNRGGD